MRLRVGPSMFVFMAMTGCSAGNVSGDWCAPACVSSLTLCDGVFVDTTSSSANCGACGATCGAQQFCSSGTCCANGTMSCGGKCIKPDSDEANCGACGVTCAQGATCIDGACACPFRQQPCGGVCARVFSDEHNCGACGVECADGVSCFHGACTTDPDFRIDVLHATDCVIAPDHDSLTGDDRGGIAVSETGFYYTGDDRTGRWDIENLDHPMPWAVLYDGLVSDLASGRLLTLATAGRPFQSGDANVDGLLVIDEKSGKLTGEHVTLSQTISISNGDSGVFSGASRLAISNREKLFEINPSSGLVTDHGSAGVPLDWSDCENWAFWGVLERYNGELSIAYVNGDSAIVRQRLSDGQLTVIQQFIDLSDMCSFTVSPSLGRWYWHHEGESQLTTQDGENAGFCPASWCDGGACFCPDAFPVSCNGVCTNTETDPSNCGGCGISCLAHGVCLGSVCGCGEKFPTLCGNSCTDLSRDSQNCGACGTVCDADKSCWGGSCTTTVGVALFTNDAYVDYAYAQAGEKPNEAEGYTVEQGLISLGFDVASFTGLLDTDFQVATLGAGALVIPEQENGSLSADLTPGAITVIEQFVANGGRLIVSDDYSSPNLLDTVFGFSLPTRTVNAVAPISLDVAAAIGTSFEGAAATLAVNDATEGVIASSLPAGAKVFYSDGVGVAMVFAIQHGSGWIVWLAYDWYNAAPVGAQDGGWLEILERALHF